METNDLNLGPSNAIFSISVLLVYASVCFSTGARHFRRWSANFAESDKLDDVLADLAEQRETSESDTSFTSPDTSKSTGNTGVDKQRLLSLANCKFIPIRGDDTTIDESEYNMKEGFNETVGYTNGMIFYGKRSVSFNCVSNHVLIYKGFLANAIPVSTLVLEYE